MKIINRTDIEDLTTITKPFIVFCLKELDLVKRHDQITLIFEKRPKKLGYTGYCESTKRIGEHFFESKQLVKIFVGKELTYYDINTIAHELTHAKQFLSGELFFTENNTHWKNFDKPWFWGMTTFKKNPIKYLLSPWEIDARRSARKLIKKYMKGVKS